MIIRIYIVIIYLLIRLIPNLSSELYNYLVAKIRKHYRNRRIKKEYSFIIEQRQLFIRSQNYWELRNKNVVVTYDFNKKILKIYDKKVKGRYSTIEWSKEIKSFVAQNPYLLDESFEELCAIFCDSFTYERIVKNLSHFYDPIETLPPIKKISKPKHEILINPLDKIDINNATEEEIATLAGINIVTAKKIVQYRELHNGFKTKEEFYKAGKIKKHFIEQIKFLITIEEINKKPTAQQERIIDF